MEKKDTQGRANIIFCLVDQEELKGGSAVVFSPHIIFMMELTVLVNIHCLCRVQESLRGTCISFCAFSVRTE